MGRSLPKRVVYSFEDGIFKFIHMEASINCWCTDTLGVGVAISVGGSPIGPSPGWAALRASTTRVDPPPAQESPVPRLQRALQPKEKGEGEPPTENFQGTRPSP